MNAVLLSGIWQGALISGIAALIVLAIPQRHAATRYAVWFAALLALAIVPVASLWHPAQAIVSGPVEQTAIATSTITVRAAAAGGNWFAIAWLAGVAVFLSRLAWSFIRIKRIVRNAVPAPAIGANVAISKEIPFPIAAGIVSPTIVLPAGIAETLEPDELEAVIRHERAHIRRGDLAGNLVQRTIEAALFFNPWVYLIGRQLVKERESACDDWAVYAVREPERYASCLAQLAQSARAPRTPLLTPSAIGSSSMLVGRVARLLNGKVAQVKINYAVLAASVLSFAVLAFFLQTSSVMASAVAAVPAGTQTLASNRVQTLGCNADVSVVNPAMPNIAAGDIHPGASADAIVTVAANGQPVSAKIRKSSGYPAIDRATIKAAMATAYAPARRNCQAVAGQYLFHIQTA